MNGPLLPWLILGAGLAALAALMAFIAFVLHRAGGFATLARHHPGAAFPAPGVGARCWERATVVSGRVTLRRLADVCIEGDRLRLSPRMWPRAWFPVLAIPRRAFEQVELHDQHGVRWRSAQVAGVRLLFLGPKPLVEDRFWDA